MQVVYDQVHETQQGLQVNTAGLHVYILMMQGIP